MFPTRSLLVHVDCPDFLTDSCHRPSCPFAHNDSKKRQKHAEYEGDEAVIGASTTSLKRKASEDGKGGVRVATVKRAPNSELNTLLSALNAGPRNAYAAKKQLEQQEPTQQRLQEPARANLAAKIPPQSSQSRISASAANPSTTRSGPSAPQQNATSSSLSSSLPNSNDLLEPPSIPRISHPGSSAVPYTSRQTSLRTLYTTFQSLYSPLVPRGLSSTSSKSKMRAQELLKRLAHHYASQDSTSTESKIFKSSSVNFLSYRNSIRTSLVGLTRRQKIDKEAEEKGQGECICMLSIQAMEAACLVDVKSAAMATSTMDQEINKIIEDQIVQILTQSPLIGTSEEVERKIKDRNERSKGTLNRFRLESAKLLTEKEVLVSVGYPCPDLGEDGDDLQASILKCWGQGDIERDLVGHQVVCERCSALFKVKPMGPDDNEEREACSFHWGKRVFVREKNVAKGPRLPRWTCCDQLDEATTFASNSLSQVASSAGLIESSNGQSSAPKGCTRGPHVFKEEKPEALHKRVGFLSTEQVCSDFKDSDIETRKKYDVLAFDCELVYTTAGMSLARLTVLDESGQVTMDQYVKPRAAILDYNTRYSGIKEEDLQGELNDAVDLEEARRLMVSMMTPSTILVGHGLENDLKALRLVHLQVADSALLYKHHKGLPFRFSLRDLTLKHLGKHIQSGDALSGHDPEEDARSALDLVRLKYREFAESPALQSTASLKPEISLPPSPTTQPPSPAKSSASSTRSIVSSGPSEAAKASLFLKPMRKKAK